MRFSSLLRRAGLKIWLSYENADPGKIRGLSQPFKDPERDLKVVYGLTEEPP
jgi:hypothetical protein